MQNRVRVVTKRGFNLFKMTDSSEQATVLEDSEYNLVSVIAHGPDHDERLKKFLDDYFPNQGE